MKIKPILYTFFGLVCLALLTPLIVDKDYLFPFILPRALFLRIVLDLALPFYLYLIIAKKEFRPNLRNPLNLAVLIFLVINFVSAFLGANPLRSVWGNIERMGGAWYLGHLTLLYFYVLLLAQASGRLLHRFLKIFLWISIASVLYGLWVYLGLPGFYNDPSLPARVSSSFGNPIFFASFLVLPLFLTIFFALQEESPIWKGVYWVMALLQLLGIYQSATRGAFVGLVIGIFLASILYLTRAESRKFRYYGYTVTGGIVAIVALLFVFGGKLPTSSFLYRITHLKDNNSSARLIQWKTALQGFKDKPVLGVGPENYYIIANKYYNPEMNKYDGSWFDKPHNYLLEILVTTGVAGFVSYAAVLIFFVWGLAKAFRKDLITWLEFCLLLGGMIVYQVQNIFVFDTISASVAFFIYLGFGAYLWYEAEQAEKKKEPVKAANNISPGFLYAVLGVSFVIVVYAIYLTGIVPGRVAKGINYGYAYAGVDPQKSEEYFQTALNQPFVFDPGELGMRYEELAAALVNNQPQGISKDFVNKVLDNVIAALQQANARMGNYPIFWYKLAEAYNLQSFYNNQGVNPLAVEAAEKAYELAPTRPETIAFLIQVKAFQGKMDEAVALAEKMQNMYPWSLDTKWRLAMVYNYAGKNDQAIATANQAFSEGYKVKQPSDIQWLVKIYTDNKDYTALISLYQRSIEDNPQEPQFYANLATVYSKTGDKQKAIEVANKILVIKPDAKADVENFIKTLEGQK